jgi:hypothetical protein
LKYIVITLILICTNLFADFRVSHSTWESKSGIVFEYDKEEHFYEGCGIYALSRKKFGPVESLFITAGLNLAWEIKDGFMHCERYGYLGGEGFCIKDFLASFVGSFISFFIEYLFDGKE